jgi:hypothetical protein
MVRPTVSPVRPTPRRLIKFTEPLAPRAIPSGQPSVNVRVKADDVEREMRCLPRLTLAMVLVVIVWFVRLEGRFIKIGKVFFLNTKPNVSSEPQTHCLY